MDDCGVERTRDKPKVGVGCADEVGERGAFRMVNRILFAAAAGG